MPDLATSAGLAARWGLSRQRVDQIIAGASDFPAPELIDTGGRFIRAFPVDAAEQWVSEVGYKPTRPTGPRGPNKRSKSHA